MRIYQLDRVKCTTDNRQCGDLDGGIRGESHEGGVTMIIWTIIIAVVVLFGALTMYAFGSYVEHRGYIRGLEEAEEIMREVQDER